MTGYRVLLSSTQVRQWLLSCSTLRPGDLARWYSLSGGRSLMMAIIKSVAVDRHLIRLTSRQAHPFLDPEISGKCAGAVSPIFAGSCGIS